MLERVRKTFTFIPGNFPTVVQSLSEGCQPGLKDVARPERGPDFPQGFTIHDVTSVIIRPHASIFGLPIPVD